MLLSATVGMKDWEATGWEIRPYYFTAIEVPPPADYTALKTPQLDDLTPIGGFSLESEKGARREEDEQQQRLHSAAQQCFGTLSGGDPDLATLAKARVRRKIRERHARPRSD